MLLIIIAKDRLDPISQKVNFPLKICATFKGKIIEKAVYKNLLMNRESEVLIGGEYITTETGTGLVRVKPHHRVNLGLDCHC